MEGRLLEKTSPRGLMITMIKFPAQTIMSKRIIGIIIVGQHGIQNTFKNYTINLNFNHGGRHSNECIHYAK